MEVQVNKTYELEYWFRTKHFEKDFATISIVAETLDIAKEKVLEIRPNIFSIELLKQLDESKSN